MSKFNRRRMRKSSALPGQFSLEHLETRTLLSGQLYIVNNGAQKIQQYSTTGTAINTSLIPNLKDVNGIAVSGSTIFETNYSFHTVGEYTTSGLPINTNLIAGLNEPEGIFVSGSDLFIADSGTGTIGEYTTSGAVINAALVTGLNQPVGLVVSGSNLYVTLAGGSVNEYTTSGTVVAAPLISGLSSASGIVLDGSDLFVEDYSFDQIGEYNATTGAAINASLIIGLNSPFGLALDGSTLFVSNNNGVGEYTTAGTTINAHLIAGTTELLGIAVVDPPPLPPAGSPDSTFNNGNPVALNFAAQASALTSAGQTILAGLKPSGNGTAAVLEQLTTTGALDTSFGSNGFVTDTATGDEAFYSVVTEADGTIVAAGVSHQNLLLAGYNADGSVDRSFGSGGREVISIAGASSIAYGLTTDANGNLLVVGSTGNQFLIDRFSALGQQDATFNSGAPLVFGTASDGDVLGKVAVESNGDIVAAGASAGSVAVVRFAPSGALDSTFGTGGILILSQLTAPDLLGKPDYTEGLTIDSQNRILVANTNAAGDFAAARLTPGGYLDSTFGTGGIVASNFGGTDDADFIAVQPDTSQILIAGTTTTNGVVSALIAAYTPTGLLDTTFGNAGTEILDAGVSATPTQLQTVLLVPRPQAEGIGTIIQQVFGTYGNGKITVGQSTDGSGKASGIVQRFNAQPPTDTPLQIGTLGATLSIKLPTAVIGGAKTKTVVPVIVKNSGNQLVSGPVTVSVFFSLGPSLGGATQLAAISPTVHLRASTRDVVHLRIPAIPALPAGVYYLIAEVTAPDGSTTGVAGPSTTLSPPFAEIAISAVTGPTKPIAPGKPTAVTFKLQNEGNVIANANVELTITASTDTTAADGQTLAAIPWKLTLKPGQLRQFRIPLRLAKTFGAGQDYLIVDLNLAAVTDIVVPNISAFSASTVTVT
jgi:uncharacterized delta-60 repeat protein